jgi:hypothetical protein
VRKPLLVAAALCAAAGHATAGEFMDTRLVFIVGDDDFMHDAGVTVPPSPRPDIGDRAGYDQFYDNRESSERGIESRTHLVLHAAADGYFEGITTDAAMVLEFDHDRILNGDPRSVADDGSYLRITDDLGEPELEVIMMPFSSDRLRLGYLWDISWGGDDVFPGATIVPGFKVTWDAPFYSIEAGAKTARMQFVTRDLDERSGQIEAFYGLFGGFGVGRRKEGLRLDANGGFFEKGRNPNSAVRGERVDAGGVSARLSYVDGLPFLPTTDTRIYSSDPLVPWNVEPWGVGGWRAAVEATYVGQVLEDVEKTGGTKIEPGLAAAAQLKLQTGNTRFSALGIYRDLGFLFFNQPGVNQRFQALSEDVDTTPEIVATVSVEHHLPESHLTPGLTLGAQLPASTSNTVPRAGSYAPDALKGRRTIVYRRADMFDDTGLLTGFIIPDGEDALPVFGARASTQLDLAAGFALIGEVTLLYDSNRAKLVQDPLQVNTLREFDEPLTVGAAVMARAEF